MSLALVLGQAALAADAGPPETDFPTVLAIGVTTFVGTSIVHEGLGHQLGCLAGGERPQGFSTSVAGCDSRTSGSFGQALSSAGGATANLLVGGGFAAGLLLAPPRNGSAYYAEWLFSTVNLFHAGGYLMVGPWFPVGDWGTGGVLENVDNPLPWQITLSAAGLGMTAGTLFLSNHLAEPLLGDDDGLRKRRRWTLTLPAYLAGGTLITGSALLNRAGPEFAVSAAVANFAGTLFLAYMPIFFSNDVFYPSRASSPRRALEIRRSVPWLVVGSVAAVGAVTVLGPGIGRFPEPHPLFPGQ